MKSKFNIKEFFLLHIEKIVFGIAIILAVFFMLGGKKLESLKWQPNELVEVSQRASNRIDTNVVQMKDIKVEEKNYAEFAKGIKVGVKLEPYRTPTPWEVSLFPRKPLREKPALYALERLQGKSGVGAVIVNDRTPGAVPTTGGGSYGASGLTGSAGAGATKKEGQRWIVLVGDIPIQKQLNAYINTFSGASYTDPMNRDIPKYMYYKVFRQEWPTANEDQWEERENVYTTWANKMQEWAVGAQAQTASLEPVDQAYLAPVTLVPMAFPLPPLAGSLGFGNSVAHPPNIPLLKDDVFRQMREQGDYLKQLENLSRPNVSDLDEFNPFAGGTGGNFGSGQNYGDSSSGSGYGPQRSPGGGRFVPNSAISRLQMERDAEEPVRVSHYLFRYFDFNVVPGKTYRYKVKLVLANPNFSLEEKVLAESAAKERFVNFLETDFSEPSPPITVSLDTRALVSQVQSSPLLNVTPKATMRMIRFDMSDSTEWVLDGKTVERGSFLNWANDTGYAAEPTAPAVSASDSYMAPVPTTGRTTAVASTTDKRRTSFVSNICLLDIAGGYQIGSGAQAVRSPGRILVMEDDGNVVVHDVAGDANDVRDYDEKTAPATGGAYGPGIRAI